MNQIEIVAIKKSAFTSLVKLGIGRTRKFRSSYELGTLRYQFMDACRQAKIPVALGLEIVNDHVGAL